MAKGINALSAIVLGAAVGAATALLLAPDNGDTTRRKLNHKLKDLNDKVDSTIAKGKEAVDATIAKGKDSVEGFKRDAKSQIDTALHGKTVKDAEPGANSGFPQS